MKKLISKILLTAILMTSMSGCLILDLNQQLADDLVPGENDLENILKNEAIALFHEKKGILTEEEWEKGPCLGYVNDDWVADVVHRPMGDVDWDMKNQCHQYYDGDASHYILLDFARKNLPKPSLLCC